MEFFRVYGRVIGLLRAEKGLAITLAIANIAVAGLQFYEPVLFGKVIDLLSNARGRPVDQLWSDAREILGLWALVGLGGIVANMVVSLQADRMAHRRRLGAMATYFQHLLMLPFSFHNAQHSGRLIKIMLTGVDNLFGIWLSFFRENLATLVALFVMLPLSMFMNWRLGLLLLVLILFFAVTNVWVVSKTDRLQKKVEDLHSELAGRAGDALGNINLIQSFVRLAAETSEMHRIIGQTLQAQFPVLNWWAFLSVLTRAASTDHGHPDLRAGHLALYPRRGDGRRDRELHGLRHHADRPHGPGLRFRQPHLLPDAFAGRLLPCARFAVERAGQAEWHRHRSCPGRCRVRRRQLLLRRQAPGAGAFLAEGPGRTTVAFVGPTGAGKSTALSLLHRMWDAQSGVVRIDGIDHRDIKLESLRRNIGVVFQDSTMFYRSIADNLRIGKPDATQAELEEAAKLAEAHDFIMRQPQGYETLVGERGTTLSGGERQRLAIARALLKNPPILILDEATSALDSVTEARIQKALKTLMQGRTTFVIAHRLSTIRDADQVVVFEHGRVVEQGAYQALIGQGGAFARLVATQQAGIESA
jgi:ABC-type multidrug transport system fused ATPase/permease subunit